MLQHKSDIFVSVLGVSCDTRARRVAPEYCISGTSPDRRESCNRKETDGRLDLFSSHQLDSPVLRALAQTLMFDGHEKSELIGIDLLVLLLIMRPRRHLLQSLVLVLSEKRPLLMMLLLLLGLPVVIRVDEDVLLLFLVFARSATQKLRVELLDEQLVLQVLRLLQTLLLGCCRCLSAQSLRCLGKVHLRCEASGLLQIVLMA